MNYLLMSKSLWCILLNRNYYQLTTFLKIAALKCKRRKSKIVTFLFDEFVSNYDLIF